MGETYCLLNRRRFIGGIASLGAVSLWAAGAEKPIARIGVMTDTHVFDTLESCANVKAALELFKTKNVEMIINCGDVADYFCPDGYRFYRQTVNTVYPEAASRPREVFAFANHDTIGFKKHVGSHKGLLAAQAFAEMKRLLEAPNNPTDSFTWKGLPFLVFPQPTGSKGFLTWKDYAARVDAACKANPGKPVFVIDHVPPAGTTFHSWSWGSEKCRRALEGHPQVVSISGHVHGSLASDRQIWQGSFTAINFGCLQTWGGFAAGSTPPPQAKPNFGVAVMDVYRDRLVVRRYDVRDGSEYGADDPWIIPWPFVAATAPFARDTQQKRLAAKRPAPAFAPDAKLVTNWSEKGLELDIPGVATSTRAFYYRLVLSRKNAKGVWEPFTRDDIFADFWIAPKDRTTTHYTLSRAFFPTAGETIRVSVAPLDFFDCATGPITADVVVPNAPKVVGCVSGDAVTFTENGKSVARGADGFFVPTTGQGTAWFPVTMLGKAKPGAKLTLVLELHTQCPNQDWRGWQVRLADKGIKAGWMQMPCGDPGVLKYAFDFTLGTKRPKKFGVSFNRPIETSRLKFFGATVYERF